MASNLDKPSIPFSDPLWLSGLPSPYYNESHRKWQKTCRDKVLEHVFYTFTTHNIYIPNLSAPLPIKGLKIKKFNYFYFAIYISEIYRIGIGSLALLLSTSTAYKMPPLISYKSEELKKHFLPDLLHGDKRIYVAITEPDAGSDVASIATTAEKSECGKYYILNREKK
ncbi:hypothetical protein NLU13_9779 [Sarocladium strictum]|uniref:Acyl-CoA dehydrogenase/oxidase N-terminal domain-containing protein n=1 Tax=Sarocladium strictum TaxID=5046 RepID=A0AA39L3D9_SARSR|nr:hypothetical protein NLU13_9779 [Sarocladium strictum]